MTTEFLTRPNLPEGKVTVAAISALNKEVVSSLECLGIVCLTIEPSSSLQVPVMAHADMNILHLGGCDFAANNQNEGAIQKIKGIGGKVKFISELEPDYPKDVKLNIAVIGDRVICNKYCTEREVLDYFAEIGKSIIHVKQGYSRCSLAVVNENSIMTSDKSIYQACKDYGLNSLLLESGDIVLEGYNYGFIGGCCGLIDKNLIAFTGDINKYADGEKVKSFLKDNNCDYVCLTQKKLIDVGGILPIKEFL